MPVPLVVRAGLYKIPEDTADELLHVIDIVRQTVFLGVPAGDSDAVNVLGRARDNNLVVPPVAGVVAIGGRDNQRASAPGAAYPAVEAQLRIG